MENRDSILAKIKKLYALAGNNPSIEEAQAAMLKAQELLFANGLSQSDVESFENSDDDVLKDDTLVDKGTNKVFDWQIRIAHAICPNFRVEFLMTSTAPKSHKWNARRGKTFRLIGMTRDVDMCKETLEFALSIAPKLWKEYWKSWKAYNMDAPRAITEGEKTMYMMGFAKGLKEKFAEQVQTKELIVVTPDAVIKRKDALTRGKYHGARGARMGGSSQAYNRGIQDGRKFGVGGKHKYIA